MSHITVPNMPSVENGTWALEHIPAVEGTETTSGMGESFNLLLKVTIGTGTTAEVKEYRYSVYNLSDDIIRDAANHLLRMRSEEERREEVRAVGTVDIES